MRIVVYGAGAIGGAIGARCTMAGHDTVLIARGAHYEALARTGLRLEGPSGSETVRVAVLDDPASIDWRPDDVVLLCVKSQDTTAALDRLARTGGPSVAVCSVQNGVVNEQRAARRFARVYGGCLQCPTTHLVPGVVELHSEPVVGIVDVGRWPEGVDEVASELAAALEAAGFSSLALDDVMRWKYAKLLTNLTNALEVLCGGASRRGPVAALLRAEGEACLRAAGIAFATREEEESRRGDLVANRTPIPGRTGGSSSWQSVQRGLGTVEADYLNGEVVLLGARYGVPTPVNALVGRLANQVAWDGRPPGAMTESDLLAQIPSA